MRNKIVPIGGEHKSAASLLAEIMNDPDLHHCVVITISKDGDVGKGHYEMTTAEMCYAAALIQRMAFDDE